jgi:ParB-like chromosome segregation protein Spo0J
MHETMMPGDPVPTKAQVTQVTLEDIETDEKTFQWRMDGWEKTAEGRDQIRDLVRHLRNTQEPLDPITVYPRSDQYIVVDGHHRLEAYQEVRWDKPVPVKVFQGTLQEAREAAFTANNKGRRSYSSQERLEKAWHDTKRWFFDGRKDLTVERVAKNSGTGTRTVGYMRARLRDRGVEVKDLSWAEVLRGIREYVPDPEWQDKKVQALKEALIGLNIIHYVQSPDILAMALESISPSLAWNLVVQWTPIALEIAQEHQLEQQEEQAAVDAGRYERLEI